jgi:hypothetical protein
MKDGFISYLNYQQNNFGKVNPLVGLGQLQQKEEAAGKMRTFAMVDS